MTEREIKRVILGQLASYLRREIIIDGITNDEGDMARAEKAQESLIAEFERRAGETLISKNWDAHYRASKEQS